MKGTQRIFLMVIVGLTAAALPALLWLMLHQDGPPGPEAPAPLPAVPDAADILEQRTQASVVERTDIKVVVPGECLLRIERLTRRPGEAAVAEGLRLDLPALWTDHRGKLGRKMEGFWSRLPDDCDTLRASAATVITGLSHPDGTPLVLESVPVTLTRGSGVLGIRVQKDLADGASMVVELERVSLTGNIHLTAIVGGPLPISIPWLPAAWSLRFGRLDLMGTSGLMVQGLHVLDATGLEVLRIDKLTVEADGAVPTGLLRDGLPGAAIGSARGVQLVAAEVGLRWPEAARLPLLAELEPLAVAGAAWVTSVRLTRALDAPLHLDDVAISREDRTIAKAASVDLVEGPALVFRTATLTPGIIGFSAEAPEIHVDVDSYGIMEWRMDGLSASIKPGPMDLMKATVWGTATLSKFKAILARPDEEEITPAAASIKDLSPDLRPLRDFLEGHKIRCEGCALAVVAGPVDMAFKGVTASVGWEHASELTLGFEAGGVEGTDDLAGPFSLSAALDAGGALARLQARLGGEKISALIRRAVPGRALREGRLEIDLAWSASDLGAVFGGWLRGTDLVLEHPRIAGWPVRVPAARVEVDGLWDEKADRLKISVPRLELGQVWGRGSLEVGRLSAVRTFTAEVDFPEQDCGQLFAAIPKELVPHLAEAVFQGSLWFRGAFKVDLEDIRKTIKLDLSGDWDRCRAVSFGPTVNVDALKRDDFVHRVVVKGEDLGVVVGPGTDAFTQLHRIPKYVQAAAWGTEDLAFFKHHGFKLSLIRRAVILLLERGYFAYGGSTVSQQLVKNLFLYRAKTLSRKLEEAIITWHMEKTLSKDRILELYLNCIEFGPKIWGIKRAAKIYFGKRPDQLSPLEGAFIMANKPDPPYGYYMYRRGKVNDRWKKKLGRVMDRLHFQMGVINAAQYKAESNLEPRFRRPGSDEPPAEPPPAVDREEPEEPPPAAPEEP